MSSPWRLAWAGVAALLLAVFISTAIVQGHWRPLTWSQQPFEEDGPSSDVAGVPEALSPFNGGDRLELASVRDGIDPGGMLADLSEGSGSAVAALSVAFDPETKWGIDIQGDLPGLVDGSDDGSGPGSMNSPGLGGGGWGFGGGGGAGGRFGELRSEPFGDTPDAVADDSGAGGGTGEASEAPGGPGAPGSPGGYSYTFVSASTLGGSNPIDPIVVPVPPGGSPGKGPKDDLPYFIGPPDEPPGDGGPTPAPEPGTLVFLASGLLLMARRLKRTHRGQEGVASPVAPSDKDD